MEPGPNCREIPILRWIRDPRVNERLTDTALRQWNGKLYGIVGYYVFSKIDVLILVATKYFLCIVTSSKLLQTKEK